MNRNFLEKYHQELKNFREASKEFAKEHPAVAGHLGLLAPEIEDPYVERLIEAVSFLTARINLKIDEQYPKFLEHIFQVIQPSFNKVIPSCAIVSCYTNENTPFIIPAQSSVFTHAKKKNTATCNFSTCHPLQITPFHIQKVNYIKTFKNNYLSQERQKAKLDIIFSFPKTLSIKDIDFSCIHFYIKNTDHYTATELLYHLSTKATSLSVSQKDHKNIYSPKIKLTGMDFNLDISNDRKISHLKDVVEYSILPEKTLFFTINDLQAIITDCLKRHKKTSSDDMVEFTLSFGLSDFSDNIEKYLTHDCLDLNSMIISNHFIKKTRFVIDQNTNEQHIVMDKIRAKDFEIISIKSIEGFNSVNTKIKSFEPIYKVDGYHALENTQDVGFYTDTYRSNQLASTNNSYKGNECYVTITNQYQHITQHDLNQLSVEAWCSNRSLVRDISWTLDEDLQLDDRFKITKIVRQCRFTEPLDSPSHTVAQWRLMNLIASNFIIDDLNNVESLTNHIKDSLLTIHEMSKNQSFKAQIDAIISITACKTHESHKRNRKLIPLNGLHFETIIDEAVMSHAHPYIWGCVLLSHLKGYSPINHFTKLTLRNKKSEIIATLSSLE